MPDDANDSKGNKNVLKHLFLQIIVVYVLFDVYRCGRIYR